ncbi:hypothetical protein [Arcobacter sp.]|uniref:hypothetical protein n=1 Tax=unclassified Arcobacter TaxID=2593671 RepID=UPI003AFFCF9A
MSLNLSTDLENYIKKRYEEHKSSSYRPLAFDVFRENILSNKSIKQQLHIKEQQNNKEFYICTGKCGNTLHKSNYTYINGKRDTECKDCKKERIRASKREYAAKRRERLRELKLKGRGR